MVTELEIDNLYRLPLAEFVVARNELSKTLRKAGDRETATQVKALVKPSLTAWVVNQLAFEAADEMAALMAAGARLRETHLTAPAEHQEATRARRAAISVLLDLADKVMTASGNPPHRGHRQRISLTLETLSSQVADTEEPKAGRLSRDLEPKGFDAVADLASALGQLQASRPTTTPPPLRLVPPPVDAELDGDAEDAVAEDAVVEDAAVEDAGVEDAVAENADKLDEDDVRRAGEQDAAEDRAAKQRAAEELQQLDEALDEAQQKLAELEAQKIALRSLTRRATDELVVVEQSTEEFETAAGVAERHVDETRRRAEEAQQLADEAQRQWELAQQRRQEARAALDRGQQEANASALVLRRAEQDAEIARQSVNQLQDRRRKLTDAVDGS